MLAYDWALTLDMEINLVWKKKWNLIKAIYLFQRYVVILDACAVPLYRECDEYYNCQIGRLLTPQLDSRTSGK